MQNHNEFFELLTVLQESPERFQIPPPKHTPANTQTYTPSLLITTITLSYPLSLSCLTVLFFINNYKNKQSPQKFSRKSMSRATGNQNLKIVAK